MKDRINFLITPVTDEEYDIWYRANNISIEKIQLFEDFCVSLYYLIKETYLGGGDVTTKIQLTKEDNSAHFKWAWNKIISNFMKEGINFDFSYEGGSEDYDYFESFYYDIFYNNELDEEFKAVITNNFFDLFDYNRTLTKGDLSLFTELYKTLNRSLVE